MVETVPEDWVKEIMDRRKIVRSGHFVFTNGAHAPNYFNKDGAYPYTRDISALCRGIAEFFVEDGIEVVIGPEKGGIILSQWAAHHLMELTGREVLAIYAERQEESIVKSRDVPLTIVLELPGGEKKTVVLEPGDELLARRKQFKIGRGYDALVVAKRALIIEDVLTTGTSAREAGHAARRAGAEVVACGALCNRGNVSAETIAVDRCEALYRASMIMWTEEECAATELCSKRVPINTEVGKGTAFLARIRAEKA